jgi:glutamine synthetase
MSIKPPPHNAEIANLPPGTAFVDAFVADVNGSLRGKRVTASAWASAARNGVAFSRSALILDARGASLGPLGLGTEDGDPDGAAFPVPGQLASVPWAGPMVAQCLLSMRDGDGGMLWYDPREVLRSVVERCRADGILPVVSVELEFYLVGADATGRPVPLAPRRGGVARIGGGHLCLQQVQDFAPFLHALHSALKSQNIPADGLVSEYGPGQFELNLLHGPDPVLAADHAVLQRRATMAVAAQHGFRASFMAKPFAAHAGSGLHVHISLVDEAGRNRFGAPDGENLLESAVAGMQAFHAQSMALFAPSFSAYRRYCAGAFVALSSAWGEDNRSVAFRVPRSPPAARRIEHRVAAADASPHLVLAAILASVHHGVTHRLTPTAPVTGNADRGADPLLPRDIFTALSAFEHGKALGAYLPPQFPRLFSDLKRAEAEALFAEVQPVELDFYL